jgi:MYXO-CTERM domain-containing protein
VPDTSGECADEDPEGAINGSCGCGSGSTRPGLGGTPLLLLLLSGLTPRRGRSRKSRSRTGV